MGACKDMYTGNEWDIYLAEEYKKPYFRALEKYVTEAYRTKVVLPPKDRVFKAFKYTDFHKVKCVILGQDPYPNPGDACGLAFSVNPEVPIPRSLINIFKELTSDLHIPYPAHGNLTSWAEQGVLLLNSTLTVEAYNVNSHKHLGWDTFTDAAIKQLSDRRENIVFLLWGKYAQTKKHLIDTTKHLILETSHPSPHSASRGFNGSKHFSKTNLYLQVHGKEEIDWAIRQ